MAHQGFKEWLTSQERLAAMRAGKPYDRVPCDPFIGPFAAKVAGISVAEYHRSAKKMAESQLTAYRKYGYDEVGLSIRVATLRALGETVVYPEEAAPYITDRLIAGPDDLERLSPLERLDDPYLQAAFEAAELLVGEVGGEVPVSVGIRAPFSTAATLRGVEDFMKDLYYAPEFAHRILRFALASTLPLIRKIHSLGALVSISDPVASGNLISPKHYREYAFPYSRDLIQAIRTIGGAAPTLHICGNTAKIWQDMANTGAGALSVQDGLDLALMKQLVGGRVTIAGNVRPTEAMYLGTPQDVEADVIKGLAQAKDNPKGYIVQLGCVLPLTSPEENLQAFMEAVRRHGQYQREEENLA